MNNNMNENTKVTNTSDIENSPISRILQSLINSIRDTPTTDDMKGIYHLPIEPNMSYLDGIIVRIDKEWRKITNDNILLKLTTVPCAKNIDCIRFDNTFYISGVDDNNFKGCINIDTIDMREMTVCVNIDGLKTLIYSCTELHPGEHITFNQFNNMTSFEPFMHIIRIYMKYIYHRCLILCEYFIQLKRTNDVDIISKNLDVLNFYHCGRIHTASESFMSISQEELKICRYDPSLRDGIVKNMVTNYINEILNNPFISCIINDCNFTNDEIAACLICNNYLILHLIDNVGIHCYHDNIYNHIIKSWINNLYKHFFGDNTI